MSLRAILEEIHLSGEAQVREIQSQALDQANQLLEEARLQAEQIEKDVREKEILPAYRERARILHRARLESLRVLGDAREALVDEALDRARGRLAGIRNDPAYSQILRRLVQETMDELEGTLEDIRLASMEADPRDREVLEKILEEMELSLTVESSIKSWGGVVARSSDGRIVITNTLEARFSRAVPFLRRHLAIFFENELAEREGEKQRARAMAYYK